MTQEKKAKAYDEALERAKKLSIDNAYASQGAVIKSIFPELAESEDERIRRWLVELVENQEPKVFIEVKKMDVFAYLEKQKDLKYSEEHMEDIRQYAYNKGIVDEREKQKETHFTKRNALFDECVKNCDPEIMKRVSDEIDAMLQKEQKPAEWNEEDDQLIGFIFDLLSTLVWRKDWAMSKEECLGRLKSLRPQSKEDIDAIAKREYARGKQNGYWEGYKKAQEDHNNSVAFHYDYPTSPSIKRSCYEGGPCTNPQMDCINCPRKITGGMFNTASSSGDPTLKAEWKPSEEQMSALDNARFCKAYDRTELDSLYEQLNKLFCL